MAELTVNKGERYTTDSLFQWDLGQVLEIHGLSLSSDPEIHFTTEVLNGAIVRQATRDDKGIISVKIPNSLLQKPYKIDIFVCVYEGDTFQTLYKMSIPIIPRKRPFDYTLEDTDEEIYSFNALENKLHETLKTLTVITDEALLDLQKSGAENLASVNQKADETLARLEEVAAESLTQLTETCTEAVETVNQKYDSTVSEFDRLGSEKVKELTDNFNERVDDVRNEIMGDTGTMLENKINAVDTKLGGLIGVIGTVSIGVGSWSNKTYTITSELIKENSIVDLYYSPDSKGIIADAEPSYAVEVGRIVITVNMVPAGTVTINSIKVVNDV